MSREIKTQRQLGCWLNGWAALWEHRKAAEPEQLSTAWANGYQQAVRDIAAVHHRLTPDWMKVWNGTNGSTFTHDEEDAA